MVESAAHDSKTLTKADIVESVHRKIGFSKKDSAEITEKVFESIKKSLERGEYVKLSGFGKFEVRQKRKRRGRNPQTGEEIEITERKVLSFKASQILRHALLESKDGEDK
ncbi:MAG: integration host factor subunit alpha [Myxococcales bacterium]|nr:integration host factor subunit alpha [Myxococcales bacterium]USN51232.1 MAG: integration host factor subunit alpha [Myxococcales bacterium]